MKKYTDKEFANSMLEMRKNNGQARRLYYKANKYRLVFFFGLIALLLGIGAFARAWGFCGFVLGLAVGILSRDRDWNHLQQARWPFHAKVTDWEKVENLANENKIS